MIFIMFAAIESLNDVRSRTVVLGSGRYLFHLGDPVRAIYLVKVGYVHLVRHQDDGTVLILQKGGPGSVVAEASVYSEVYHCDAMASRPTQLRRFAKPDILLHLPAIPRSRMFGQGTSLMNSRGPDCTLRFFSIKTVAKRLDAWIASHGETPQKGDWRMIAREIGVSAEALYREMAKRRQ